jgi:hypothetical protein
MDLRYISKSKVYLNGERLTKKRGQVTGDFTRDIYYNNEFIVKIDFGDGKQSLIEYKKWNEFLEHHKKFFVPVLEFGKIKNTEYVIMEKKKFRKHPNPKKHKDKDKFLEILEYYDLRWDADIYPDNTMYGCGITTDNKILCYDYGRLKKD